MIGYRDYGLRRASPPPAHSSDCPTRSRHRGVAVLAHCLFLSSLRRFLTIVLFLLTLNMLSSACRGPTQDTFSPVACDESSVSQQTFSHLRVPLTQLILAIQTGCTHGKRGILGVLGCSYLRYENLVGHGPVRVRGSSSILEWRRTSPKSRGTPRPSGVLVSGRS